MASRPVLLFLILLFYVIPIQKILTQSTAADSLRQSLDTYRFQASFQPSDTAYFAMADAVCNNYFTAFELDSLLAVSNRALLLLDQVRSDKNKVNVRLKYYKMRFFRYNGIAFHQQGDYVNAFDYFKQYSNVAEQINSTMDMGNSNTFIAYCHRDLEDYKLAYEYAIKAQKILRYTPYKSALANTYSVVGTYYDHIVVNVDSAIYYSKEAMRLYHEDNNTTSEINATFDLLQYLSSQFQTDSCFFYLNKLKPLVMERQSADMLLRYNILMGTALYSKGDYKQALYYLGLGCESANESEHPQFVFNAYKTMALAQAANGQALESLKSINKCLDAYAQDIGSEHVRLVNSSQLNFEFDKKQAQATLELQKQKSIRDISLLGLLLGLVVALLIFRLYRQSKKSATDLAEKNKQVEQAYQSLQATQAQLVLTEKQREAQNVRVRIARDIHDELGAGLTKITIMSDVVRKKLSAQDEEMASMLQRIVENSKGVSSTLGEIVWAVNPSHDSLESLANYMKRYTDNFLEGTGVDGIFDFPALVPDQPVAPELKRNIFLVLKEALNNCIKYAKADKVWVAFQTDGRTFKLRIHDNGIGFKIEEPDRNSNTGNGLPNMKNRMEQLGGQFNLKSAPGQGCTIEITGELF